MSEATVNKIKGYIKKVGPWTSGGSLTRNYFFDETGEVIPSQSDRTYLPWACHGFMSNRGLPTSAKKIKYLVSMFNHSYFKGENLGEMTEESLYRFYDWLYNRSVWKDAYANKDPSFAFSHGTIVSTDTCDRNVLVMALMVSRSPYCTGIANRSAWLMDQLGVQNEEVAHLLAHWIFPGKETNDFTVMQWGHSYAMFNPGYISEERAADFVKRQLPKCFTENPILWRKNPGYANLSDRMGMYGFSGKVDEYAFLKQIQTIVEEFYKNQEKTGVKIPCLNPWPVLWKSYQAAINREPDHKFSKKMMPDDPKALGRHLEDSFKKYIGVGE